MEPVVVVRYSEIGLKGKNRGYFEKKLIDNIRKIVKPPEVNKRYGRIIIRLKGMSFEEIKERLRYVFGIHSFSYAYATSHDLDEIKEAVKELLTLSLKDEKTFKVQTKRSYKQFPLTSHELSAYIGAFVLEKFKNLKVDVHNPEITVGIELKEKEAFIFVGKERLYGGFPVGVSGKAILLLSGGIDSPVAGWYMLKRGLKIETLSFLSPPFTSEKSAKKVLDLASILAKYSPEPIKANIVSFTEVQQYIKKNAPDKYSLILQRRSMMRIANKLSRKRHAKALITGENIAQVASQTLSNLASIEDASNVPVLRPLIGFEKIDIVEKAKEIGTYEISILPYIDSCVAFAPKNPATNSSVEILRDLESGLKELHDLEEKAYREIKSYTLGRDL
ncbi:thiamine biosynthesis protein ThiI [Thermosipho melanesiensis]|uniref:Probable tRNA sulfurtransferase n=2 Tax=Thermosipho melanesiensis TaxID=46541 RepID=A6LJA6_THEM4|nr:tRNA uracil 4-sulfurtransferase ThiI [Thermosipho melanesiensis]ABR30007.1 thiamine biosynthesis/tRNA modification protein ThiI [Thermosipho melanesiensis BI429]APT73211.1 thiamine biosynthesis protein ThiI [Thermosipho melanesiensis]OOC38605.1 thiamine biosynthesis protein ThiI [Thermosipho melanesiensis]OOC40409.1 thiamine biosynthesis protein ThiI [Thermosipho melanesiensis]OOC40673.1 thiamine biosynthesis protein ThiI [Thermosipho melanesiensis]